MRFQRILYFRKRLSTEQKTALKKQEVSKTNTQESIDNIQHFICKNHAIFMFVVIDSATTAGRIAQIL
jgi:hypothetical protein